MAHASWISLRRSALTLCVTPCLLGDWHWSHLVTPFLSMIARFPGSKGPSPCCTRFSKLASRSHRESRLNCLNASTCSNAGTAKRSREPGPSLMMRQPHRQNLVQIYPCSTATPSSAQASGGRCWRATSGHVVVVDDQPGRMVCYWKWTISYRVHGGELTRWATYRRSVRSAISGKATGMTPTCGACRELIPSKPSDEPEGATA